MLTAMNHPTWRSLDFFQGTVIHTSIFSCIVFGVLAILCAWIFTRNSRTGILPRAKKFFVYGLGLIFIPQSIVLLIAVGYGFGVASGWIQQSPFSVQAGMHHEMQLLLYILIFVVIPKYIGWLFVAVGGIMSVLPFIRGKQLSNS